MKIVEELKVSFKTGGVLTKLIYINIAVFLVYNLLEILFRITGNISAFNLA